jgi:hypothetical protein
VGWAPEYAEARTILETLFEDAEEDSRRKRVAKVPQRVEEASMTAATSSPAMRRAASTSFVQVKQWANSANARGRPVVNSSRGEVRRRRCR